MLDNYMHMGTDINTGTDRNVRNMYIPSNTSASCVRTQGYAAASVHSKAMTQ